MAECSSAESVLEAAALIKANGQKINKFTNGTESETVQLGTGSPTPSLRKLVHDIFNDSELVHRHSSETVNGTKTFIEPIIGSIVKYISDGNYTDIVNVKDYIQRNNRVATIRIFNNDGSNSVLIGVHDEENSAPAGLNIKSTDGVLELDFSGTATITKVIGSLQGNSDSATKLATARKLKTNLASTTDATFDGSAAQESIPVTGVLPIANGGTGSNTKNFVGLTGEQVVGGSKIFTSNLELYKNIPILKLIESGTGYIDITFYYGARGSESRKGLIRSTPNGSLSLLAQNSNSDSIFAGPGLALYNTGGFDLIVSDGTTDTRLAGTSNGSLSWGGQPIQTASDERMKTATSIIPDEVLDAWGDIQWGQFQYLDAVAKKGSSARLHLGLIAQKVKAVFEARGLDACDYGILCHEERPAVDEETVVVDAEAYTDDSGVEHPAVTHVETRHEDAVDLWTVRYDEAQAMEAAFQRRRADRLEARIATLEEKLNG